MPTFPTPTADGQPFSTSQYDYIWNATTQKWLQKQSNPSLKHRLLSDSASITLDLSAQSSFELSIKGQSLAPVVSFSNPPTQAGKFTVKVKNDFDLQRSALLYTNKTHSTLAPLGFTTSSSPGIAFSTDGTRMFVGDDTATRIFQFDLTTPWNIQSRVYNNVFYLTTLAAASLSSNMTFSHDGRYMFLMKTDTMFLYRIDLATAWDLSTASYTGSFVDLGLKVGLADVASNSQVQFNSNGATPGSRMFFILGNYIMYEVDFVTPYDLPNAVYNNVGKNLRSFTSRASGSFIGFALNASGTRIILSDITGNDIIQVNLGSSYSLASMADPPIPATFATGGIPSETAIRGMYLKPDETKLFIMGLTLYSVYELNIATGWTSPANFTYAGNSVKFFNTTFGRAYQSAHFSTDGKTLFVLTAGTATIFQFDLRIPWDISSMVYANKSFGFEATQTGPQQMYLSPDGINLFTTGATDDQIEYFRLSTANDISTASYVSSIAHTTLPSGALNQSNIYFSNDGKRLFTADANTIRWWNLTTAWTLSPGATYAGQTTIGGYTSLTTINSVAEISFSERGDILYFLEQDFNAIFSVKLSTPWDPSTGTAAVETVKFATQTTGIQGFAFSRDSSKCFVLGGNNTNIYEYQSTVVNDTITAAPAFAGYTTGSAYTNVSTSAKDGLLFKPDGMRMWYNVGTTTYQANLTIPWDIQTIQSPTPISNISGQSVSILTGMQFSDDGYKFYINANGVAGASYIAEVPLAQPWDLSTAIIASRLVLNYGTAGGGAISYPYGLHIDASGTKLYVSGEYSTLSKIYYYTMSKFNLSTLSYVGVGTIANLAIAIALNAAGTELYTCTAGATANTPIRKYTLATLWDTRTPTLAATYTMSYVYQNYVQAAYFRPGLSEVYFGSNSSLAGTIVKNIFYDAPYTIQWPSNVRWKNNTAPTIPRLDNSSVIDFYTTDGGTTYRGVERISSAYSLQSLY